MRTSLTGAPRATWIDYPQDFIIDSAQGDIAGITHVPTNFRIHMRRETIPAELIQKEAEVGIDAKPGEMTESQNKPDHPEETPAPNPSMFEPTLQVDEEQVNNPIFTTDKMASDINLDTAMDIDWDDPKNAYSEWHHHYTGYGERDFPHEELEQHVREGSVSPEDARMLQLWELFKNEEARLDGGYSESDMSYEDYVKQEHPEWWERVEVPREERRKERSHRLYRQAFEGDKEASIYAQPNTEDTFLPPKKEEIKKQHIPLSWGTLNTEGAQMDSSSEYSHKKQEEDKLKNTPFEMKTKFASMYAGFRAGYTPSNLVSKTVPDKDPSKPMPLDIGNPTKHGKRNIDNKKAVSKGSLTNMGNIDTGTGSTYNVNKTSLGM
jgi:hypothetical protein